jgi:hypothetical protein
MKTFPIMDKARLGLVAIALAGFPTADVRAQIFIVNHSGNTIGEYSTNGSVINASWIKGLNGPEGIVISGTNLFVANLNGGTIGEYTTSGATVNAALITGLSGPSGLAVSGNHLFVGNTGNNTIGEYGTDGSTVNVALITGLNGPKALAVSGDALFVANFNNTSTNAGTIGEYTTAGATVNAALITQLAYPDGIAISGNDLFVANFGGDNAIGEYGTDGSIIKTNLIPASKVSGPEGIAISGTNLFVAISLNNLVGNYTTSGATVKASFISGLNFPTYIAVAPPPTPSQPTLAIGKVSGNQLQISWPDNAGSELQTTTDLTPPVVWQPITNGIITSDGINSLVVTNLPGGENHFFSLQTTP